MYYDLLAEHREQIKHTEWIAGLTLAAIANSGFYRPDPLRQPSDYPLSSLRAMVKTKRRPRIDRGRVAMEIRAEFDNRKARMNRLDPRAHPPR